MQSQLILLAGLLSLAPSCTLPTQATWKIGSQAEWQSATAHSEGLAIRQGLVQPQGKTGTLRSILHRPGGKQRLNTLRLCQSPTWQNWEPVPNLGPTNLQDAPVLLSLGPGDYWAFGRYGGKRRLAGFESRPARLEGFDIPLRSTPFPRQFDAPGGLAPHTGGYHAWQSRDMKHWVHHGPVTEKFSRWVTSAEHADGRTYIFYDYPNDQDPHVYVDDDLRDGKPGRNLGMAFADPSHGSDAGFIRDLQGRFHVVYEDWSPINARRRSWDSPLAGHAVSRTGVSDYRILPPAVDRRTKNTGRKGSYRHPHWAQHPDWDSGLAAYDIHDPEQEAYGDWALICIGGQYYLFGDFDPVGGHKMSVCWFTSDSLDRPFTWCGKLGQGHPDPDICFAEGRFYLFTQQKTDWVSPGPWVETVELRVGVDTDDDGQVDHWSPWQLLREQYDHIPGFAKQVSRKPASFDAANLPAGFGFCFELRLTDRTANASRPVLDTAVLGFSQASPR